MLRIFFVLLIIICLVYLVVNSRLQIVQTEIPYFLKTDRIANEHTTHIQIQVASKFKPTPNELNVLKEDYASIWAHLNELFETNNINSGKDYYTENWFKQICKYYEHQQTPEIQRKDTHHYVTLNNWSSDGLVCTITDSVTLQYQFPNHSTTSTQSVVKSVLLFQGDHWRIDAMAAEFSK